MEVEVNYIGVLLAAISSMVVGVVWYAPKIFGDRWAKLVGLTSDRKSKGAPRALAIAFVASLITAYILAHVTYLAHTFFGNSFLVDAISTAFWLWLGLTAMRILVHDVFEKRPIQLTLLSLGNELVILLVMGLIIGLAGIPVAPIMPA